MPKEDPSDERPGSPGEESAAGSSLKLEKELSEEQNEEERVKWKQNESEWRDLSPKSPAHHQTISATRSK